MGKTTEEAAALAQRLQQEKPDAFNLFKRYMYLLAVMNQGDYPEAEALNDEMQARMLSGTLKLTESAEYLDRIEAALPLL